MKIKLLRAWKYSSQEAENLAKMHHLNMKNFLVFIMFFPFYYIFQVCY